jgi:hypothetical protein
MVNICETCRAETTSEWHEKKCTTIRMCEEGYCQIASFSKPAMTYGLHGCSCVLFVTGTPGRETVHFKHHPRITECVNFVIEKQNISSVCSRVVVKTTQHGMKQWKTATATAKLVQPVFVPYIPGERGGTTWYFWRTGNTIVYADYPAEKDMPNVLYTFDQPSSAAPFLLDKWRVSNTMGSYFSSMGLVLPNERFLARHNE